MKKYSDQIRAVALDVTDEQAAHSAVQATVAAFGRLDVVVNNAGYGEIAPFEQLSSERFKAVVDTNFYGVVNVTRAALPIMRQQRSGVYSADLLCGWTPGAPAALRTCSQMGRRRIHGIVGQRSRSVRRQSVRARTGGMRTNWGARANRNTPGLLPDYDPSVGEW